jgi:hypothetical protein
MESEKQTHVSFVMNCESCTNICGEILKVGDSIAYTGCAEDFST